MSASLESVAANFPCPPPEEIEKTHTILSHYATAVEIEVIREIALRGEGLRSDVGHIAQALAGTRRKLQMRQQNTNERLRNAADRALGKPVAHVVPFGQTQLDLEDEEAGLLQRLKQAEQAEKGSHGAYKSALMPLLRKCGERCAEDYAEHTRQQAWCHQQLSVLEGVVGGRVVDYSYWSKYKVPGSDYLPALKHKSRLEDDAIGPCMTFMSADRLAADMPRVTRELKQQCVELFGESI